MKFLLICFLVGLLSVGFSQNDQVKKATGGDKVLTDVSYVGEDPNLSKLVNTDFRVLVSSEERYNEVHHIVQNRISYLKYRKKTGAIKKQEIEELTSLLDWIQELKEARKLQVEELNRKEESYEE